MSTVWMRSCKTSEEALGRPPRSSNLYPWTRRQPWRNCIDMRINSLRWKITSGPLRKPSKTISRPLRARPNRKAAKARARSVPTSNLRRGKIPSPPPPPPPQFTSLNIAYDRLLLIIGGLPDFKWPPPMRAGPDQRNRSLRCDYHRDHGHETNHCQSLKFLVEKLIRARHLRRYLREPTRGTTVSPAADRAVAYIKHASEPRPTINFILERSADSQYQSKKQRRRMLRVASVRARVNTVNDRGDIAVVLPVDGPISFPPIKPTRVITPHYDALVLTLCINSFDLHRVLVDPGSATDLLHLPAFKQMRVPIDHLHSAGRVLSGFNGAATLSVRGITFSVKAGSVTQQVLFSVVEDSGSYNAILGRAWLHTMKAVPSTYHQTISYMTNSRQVDLQGSQLVTRQCYQLSLQGREQSKCSGEPPLEDQPP